MNQALPNPAFGPDYLGPEGQTPILKARGNHWDKTSVAAALGFRWDGKKTRLFARTKKDSFNTASLIDFMGDFLKQLKRSATRPQRHPHLGPPARSPEP